jgi:hypothetical protein
MPSTHLALNYHLIFSTKNRETWMAPAWRDQLHAYMGGAINGMKSPSPSAVFQTMCNSSLACAPRTVLPM